MKEFNEYKKKFIKNLKNNIQDKYNERKTYLISNPTTPSINLDLGNFSLNSFILNIFDRRFRNITSLIPNFNDCIRPDTFGGNNYTNNNLMNHYLL